MYKKLLLLCALAFTLVSAKSEHTYKDFVILIASYNNEKFVEKNLRSALQDYPEEHYRIIYIDDASTDTTYQKAQAIIADSDKEHLFTLIHNEVNKGALCNHYETIHNLIKDEEIVVILDGDDRLASRHVLEYLNKIYLGKDIWMTYGQYREINAKNIGFNKPMPPHIIQHNLFRKYQDIPSHLRTFYAKLYKKIALDDLMLNDEFLVMCADMATGIPMIEMARDHFAFIPDVLYLYNDANPLSDHNKSRKLQIEIDQYVRSRPVYSPLKKLF